MPTDNKLLQTKPLKYRKIVDNSSNAMWVMVHLGFPNLRQTCDSDITVTKTKWEILTPIKKI